MKMCFMTVSKGKNKRGRDGRGKPQAQPSTKTLWKRINPALLSNVTGSDRLRNCYPGHGKVIDEFFRFPVSRNMTGAAKLPATLTERN